MLCFFDSLEPLEANANFTGPGLGEYSLAHWLEFRKNLRRVTLVVLPNAS